MSDSRYSDLERPPLSERALGRLLVRPGSLWRRIEVVPETGSTNADLAALAKAGAAQGTVLVAEAQTAGRGRLGRSWTAPPRSGLTFSMLLRPGAGVGLGAVPVARQGWLPLLTGVAVAAALRKATARARTGILGAEPRIGYGDQAEPAVGMAAGAAVGMAVDAVLKWPNDVLVGDRKLAGILAERVDDAVVVGVGLNVSLREAEVPVATATSLAMEHAACTDREPLLRAVLREFEGWYTAWCAVGGDPDEHPPGGYPMVTGISVSESMDGGLRKAYKNLCATLGRQVRVDLPGDRTVTGTATDIDVDGRLVVAPSATGRPIGDQPGDQPGDQWPDQRPDQPPDQALSSGDVVHVR